MIRLFILLLFITHSNHIYGGGGDPNLDPASVDIEFTTAELLGGLNIGSEVEGLSQDYTLADGTLINTANNIAFVSDDEGTTARSLTVEYGDTVTITTSGIVYLSHVLLSVAGVLNINGDVYISDRFSMLFLDGTINIDGDLSIAKMPNNFDGNYDASAGASSVFWAFGTNDILNLSGGFNKGQISPSAYSDIQINENADLPVNLKYFFVQEKSNRVKLKWSTLSEQNSDYFTLERSSNLKEWKVIHKTKAAGNSNTLIEYSFIDQSPLDLAYYRLHQVDLDGSSVYYDPIYFMKQNTSKFNVRLTPNIINIGEEITVVIENATLNSDVKILVFNNLGQSCFTKTVQATSENFDVKITFYEKVKSGLYYMLVQNNRTFSQQKIFID